MIGSLVSLELQFHANSSNIGETTVLFTRINKLNYIFVTYNDDKDIK